MMTKGTFGVIAATILAAVPPLASAQSGGAGGTHEGHAGMTKAQPSATKGGGAKQLHQQMMKGAQEMRSMKMTGDVDHDFVTAMRKHHEDGIAMARIALEHGKDDQAKAFAKKIIDEQQKDMQELDAWLAQHKPSKAAATQSGGGHSSH